MGITPPPDPTDSQSTSDNSDCQKSGIDAGKNTREIVSIAQAHFAALSKMCFETFETGRDVLKKRFYGDRDIDSLVSAYNAAIAYASHLDGWLVLEGGCGCGKTHLAASIANRAVEAGGNIIFLNITDLLDWLGASHDVTDIENTPLLVVDDLGTQNAPPWVCEKLRQILDSRYVHRHPTVITTNPRFDVIDERIQSRLHDKSLVHRIMINTPDYRNPAETYNIMLGALNQLPLMENMVFGLISSRENEPEMEVSDPSDGIKHSTRMANAISEAIKFAEHRMSQPWILFWGNCGTGKTLLAAAIANYLDIGNEHPKFIYVPDLLDWLQSVEFCAKTLEYIRHTPELLVLDGFEASVTGQKNLKIEQILYTRYHGALPTIFTSTLPPEKFGPTISVKFRDPRICHIVEFPFPAIHRRIGTV